MNILVINCGSSSLKYQIINSENDLVLLRGLCERIGVDGRLSCSFHEKQEEVFNIPMHTHEDAMSCILDILNKTGIFKNIQDIKAIGHRIAHGGEKFVASTLINDGVIKAIEEYSYLAPLHNPANVIGIRVCRKFMPKIPMVAVFDTSFHRTMPPKAYLYGIPYEYYEKYAIRKYGFHGISHSYVCHRLSEIVEKPCESLKIVTCHLGNGASICAIENGISIDTSMGISPLEGSIMGTRSGDIDPTVIEILEQKENLSLSEIINMLNHKSGVQGISGISSDFRDLDAAMRNGNERAFLAIDMFCYRVAKYIGSYVAAMNGIDFLCFTAGIGENSSFIRNSVCSYLGYLGIVIDDIANKTCGQEIKISGYQSKIGVYVIPTNEELAVARETVRCISNNKLQKSKFSKKHNIAKPIK